jgi:hypothetical protein
MTAPDFYLTTAGEYGPLSEPRACRQLARLYDHRRGDYMLVDIQPPLLGQHFGLGQTEVASLVISTRHRGQTLYPISEWPSYVYVSRLVKGPASSGAPLLEGDLEPVAWGAIFKSLQSASEYVASIGGSNGPGI